MPGDVFEMSDLPVLSYNPPLAEKIKPMQDFNESPPANSLIIASLEFHEESPMSGRCRHVVRKHVRQPDDFKKLPGVKSNLTGVDFASRIIFLTQNNSFRPLNSTRETMMALIEEHSISPRFLDTASSFCSKISNVEDSLCLPFWMYQSHESLEYMYIFKYPAQSDRAKRPWYFRQTAVYHQIRLRDCRSTYVMISPYPDTEGQQAVMDWLEAQEYTSGIQERAMGVHDVLFECYLSRHRGFATEFEDKVEALSMKMLTIGLRNIQSVTPQDMADLNHIQVKLLPQPHVLQGLKQVLNGLERAFARWRKLQPFDTDILASQWEDLLANRRNEIGAYRTNHDGLVQKCAVASQLLTSILEFNNRNISDQQRQIAVQQNAQVFLLTQFTVNDSITVRVVTAISLLFLCAATVASILDMPFFIVADNGDLSISPYIWIYPVAFVPLTCATLGYWRWNLAIKKRQRMELMMRMHGRFDKYEEASSV